MSKITDILYKVNSNNEDLPTSPFSVRYDTIAFMENKLEAFGYQDIYAEGLDLVKGEHGLSLWPSISIHFWNNEYGYWLWLHTSNKEELDIKQFISCGKKTIDLLSSPLELETLDLESLLENFLKSQNFTNVRKSVSSYKNDAYILSDGINIRLHRMNVEELLKEPWVDDELPLGSTYEDDIHFREIFNKIFKNKNEGSARVQEISTDLTQITVTIQKDSILYTLVLQNILGTSLYATEVEKSFCEIINLFIDAIQTNDYNFLSILKKSNYHLHEKANNYCASAVVCKELEIYKILAWSKNTTTNQTTYLSSDFANDFDEMDGHTFEEFCAKLISANGFEKVKTTKETGDQGIDIIAYKNDIKYGIQCKCYSADIGNKAVQEALSGKIYYNCDIGIVLTNRYFTKSAIELAQKSRIHLWDRKKLNQLIDNIIS